MSRALIRVVKEGTKWIIRREREQLGEYKLKSKAIAVAFRHAKKLSPSKVRIYSAVGKMQVESNW